jgi:hypothetical protein
MTYGWIRRFQCTTTLPFGYNGLDVFRQLLVPLAFGTNIFAQFSFMFIVFLFNVAICVKKSLGPTKHV